MRISLTGKLALGLLTATVLAGGTAIEANAATPTPPADTAQSSDTAAVEATMDAASAQAAKSGQAVSVPTLTNENSTTVANPDGTFTETISSGVAQVKRGDQWLPVDTSLVQDGAVLKPRVSRANVEVSAGGEGPLAKIVDDAGRVFAVRWPTALPKPAIKDNVATFANAAGPGADLVVTVLPTGFRHDVVLREKPSGPLELRIPVQTEGVDLAEDASGRLLLKSTAGDGKVVASGSRPVMWDASGHGKPRGDALKPIDTSVETQNGVKVLVLKPDAGFLADPKRKYPVTVFPSITLPQVETDTDVASTWASHPGDPMIIAGTMPWENGQGGDVMRSLVKFNTAKVKGKKVLLATLGMWNLETNGCGLVVGSGLTAERVTSAWDENDLNWDNKPTTTGEGAPTTRAGRGRTWTAPCASGAGFLAWPVTNIVKAWASGAPDYGIQLRGADEKEATNWRAFAASENKEQGVKPPTLAVVYTR
ncbi:DNRLRE domain-containing protein [Nonomuraea sp. 3-1Str]|uniref:DNRLRE domain-containing protein n=1 Tax=Nonomuraea sp. 3-1Str TaxID=2929801 RepID=UPI00285AC365|nr:DNRLRE domain-containing protein [Nonomuraea sp. 3-1Str]MDR8408922.1 DNRLRE domain-containing protein [Nonomuraea sp. 3-1Str]